MEPIEIVTIVIASLFVLLLLGRYIYKKAKHLPTGECSSCGHTKNKLLKDYHKTYKEECNCKRK